MSGADTLDFLLRGGWFTLVQAGRLLNDGRVLYEAGSYGTATGLALLSREELAKAKGLLRLWMNVSRGTSVDVSQELEDIANMGHVEKQRRGGGSFELPLETADLRVPESGRAAAPAEFDAILERNRMAFESLMKRAPRDRTKLRERAFYVDASDTGDWLRPADITVGDAAKVMEEARLDYWQQHRHPGIPGVSRDLDRLHAALEGGLRNRNCRPRTGRHKGQRMTRDMQRSPFRRIRVETLSELREGVRAITKGDREYRFRGDVTSGDPVDGVANAGDLRTGLERVCERIDGGLSTAALRERAMAREFVRRAHHHLSDLPARGQMLEWWALMQHHGAPTRLLDWTYSIHVAAHFAMSKASRDPKKNPAVWLISGTWCRTASADVRRTKPVSGGGLANSPMSYSDEEPMTEALMRDPVLGVWPLTPFRLNERLTIQKGTFLCPGDVGSSFEDNLIALPEHDRADHIVQFVLPHDNLKDLGEELYDANVTEATLFPGLDGFARSLEVSVRYLRLDRLTDIGWD